MPGIYTSCIIQCLIESDVTELWTLFVKIAPSLRSSVASLSIGALGVQGKMIETLNYGSFNLMLYTGI